jgi:hypothetical protein
MSGAFSIGTSQRSKFYLIYIYLNLKFSANPPKIIRSFIFIYFLIKFIINYLSFEDNYKKLKN